MLYILIGSICIYNMAKSIHPNHENKLKRLNRIIGQLKGITNMIENKKYCVDILQQTRSVTAAIKSVEQLILKDHMNACVSSAMQSKAAIIASTSGVEACVFFATNRKCEIKKLYSEVCLNTI